MRKPKSWLDRLSSAARWYLPQQEADDVIGDYRELLSGDTRTEAELARDFGRPKDVVKQLAEPGRYRLWLAGFAVLALCLVLPGLSPLPGGFYLWHWLFENRPFGCQLGMVLALLGAVGAIVWFRWNGRKGEKLPRAVPVLLAVLLVWLALVLGAGWAWLHDPLGFAEMWGKAPARVLWWELGWSVYRSMALLLGALEWGGGLGMTVIGIFALVKARTGDRRWVAVYVLAMAVMLVAMKQMAVMTNMNIDSGHEWAVLSGYFCRWAGLAAAGLIGTGVALC